MTDKPIHLFVPTFDIDACLAEVRDSLERGWTGMGDKTVAFELEWAKYIKRDHVHFLNSATAGLHLAVKLLAEKHGWQPGDEIITTPITFVSTNHAILYEGLAPVFADVDESGSLDAASVEILIGPRTRAVMFVGLGGNVGQLASIERLCRAHDLTLIVDAAHMAGTMMRDGSCPYFQADAVVHSFQAVKTLPTGDAGAISFLDPALDARARKVSWLGITKDTYTRTLHAGAYKWEYDVPDVGFKYNGNSIMAGIALVELKRLDMANAYRRLLADRYTAALASASERVRAIAHSESCLSSRHLFQVQVDGRDRDVVMTKMNANGVFPGVHYRSNTLYQPYRHCLGTALRNAVGFSERAISLPLHLRMSLSDVDRVVSVLTESLR